jgi:hypothetical protein
MQRDRAIELHVSSPFGYSRTLRSRLGLLLIWGICVSFMVCSIIDVAGFWITPLDIFVSQLVWLSSLLWFGTLGALLALITRNHVVGGTLMGITWIVLLLLEHQFLTDDLLHRVYPLLTMQSLDVISQANMTMWYIPWLQNRLIVIGISLVFFCGISWLTTRSEYLLHAES